MSYLKLAKFDSFRPGRVMFTNAAEKFSAGFIGASKTWIFAVVAIGNGIASYLAFTRGGSVSAGIEAGFVASLFVFVVFRNRRKQSATFIAYVDLERLPAESGEISGEFGFATEPRKFANISLEATWAGAPSVRAEFSTSEFTRGAEGWTTPFVLSGLPRDSGEIRLAVRCDATEISATLPATLPGNRE